MAAKKASGKAIKHKAAAPKKAVAKRAKGVKGKAAARRPSAVVHKKAAPAPRMAGKVPATTKTTAKVTAKVTAKPLDKHSAKAPAKKTGRLSDHGKSVERPPAYRPVTTPFVPRVVASLSNDSEEGDGEANANLLAGPRNVKPYIARRGEEYMNKVQLVHFRLILQTWKRDLMEEVDRTVLHMKDEAANFPDPNDRATQESEFSLELRTRDRERKLIRKIDEALKRLEDGSYGYCLETGEEIGIKRLEARPVATLCVEAQERRERREKQYGDRDDRYR